MSEGEVVRGTWVTIGHPDVADLIEALGFDWVLFDTEHAPISVETLATLVQAVDAEKVCPLVRVGAVDQYLVKAALDLGAHGVLLPLVNSAGEAERAVRFSKYPPRGVRGVAPRKAADFGMSSKEYVKTADRDTIVAVQIETKESLSNLDSILSVEGVDVAFVGPSDLTMSLGLGDARDDPKVLDAMREVVRSCKTHAKVPGILASTPEEAKRDLEMGFRFIGLGSDTMFLIGGSRVFLESVG